MPLELSIEPVLRETDQVPRPNEHSFAMCTVSYLQARAVVFASAKRFRFPHFPITARFGSHGAWLFGRGKPAHVT